MSVFQEVKQQWLKRDPDTISKKDARELSELLQAVKPSELHTIADHKDFLTVLACYRRAIDTDEFRGKNFKATITSMLSVGEDGLYSDELRFVYELIQNADDCDYIHPEDCHLDIQFDYNNGQIILSYNEVGFNPVNVYAITGTAEAAKNIADGNIHIGEKGIGFKTVFGVAERVLIQSGLFSFELHSDNYAIPIPAYGGFNRIEGTRLTLFMKSADVKRHYRELVDRYCKKDALLHQNPILFLNKLTRLHMFFDSWRSLTFSVERGTSAEQNNMKYYAGVRISSKLCDADSGRNTNEQSSLVCSWYSRRISFDRSMIRSRYGVSTNLTTREMDIHVLYPAEDDIDQSEGGALYSFLPTQVRLNMPVICHVPFKLDGSREFVDPQKGLSNENSAWFTHCCNEFAKLLFDSCEDLAHRIGTHILPYLPLVKNENIVSNSNGPKVDCLRTPVLSVKTLYKRALFKTVDGRFAQNIDCIMVDFKDPEAAYAFFDKTKLLFVAPSELTIKQSERQHISECYGIHLITNVVPLLLENALANPTYAEEIFALIEPVIDKDRQPVEEFLKDNSLRADCCSIEKLVSFPSVLKILKQYTIQCIKKKTPLKIEVCSHVATDIFDLISPDEDISEDEMGEITKSYLRSVRKNACAIAIPEKEFFLCRNATCISKNNPLSSFTEICSALDGNDMFAATLKLREVSRRLNDISDTDAEITDYAFLKELLTLRRHVKTALGEQAYRQYINLINQSGMDEQRFINELLQNADDCVYPVGAVPTFELRKTSTGIQTTYNEVGFTKSNVRAITAIGESTKKQVREGVSFREETGEKGIGFKAVFAATSKVTIHSGQFHFWLSDKEPTIPMVMSNEKTCSGTQMYFILHNNFHLKELQENDILRLCLALHRLKKLNIYGISVEIEDAENGRVISINRKKHRFERVEHTFLIQDETALRERTVGYREISPEQKIVCYLPDKKVDSDWPVYCGLPTGISSKVPLAIDAPYELTTSRESILDNRWNNLVTEELNKLITQLVVTKVKSIGIEALRYLHVENSKLSIFSDDKLCRPVLMDTLLASPILPTLKPGNFACPKDKTTNRLPSILRQFRQLKADLGIKEEYILADDGYTKFDSVLDWLQCRELPTKQVYAILGEVADKYIMNDEFRKRLYRYLFEQAIQYRQFFTEDGSAIIPVLKRKDNPSEYVTLAMARGELYTQENAVSSGSDYWVLDENRMGQNTYCTIFNQRISEMNEATARDRYISSLRRMLDESSMTGKQLSETILKVLAEFSTNKKKWLQWQEDLCPKLRGHFWFLNQDSKYYKRKVLISPEPQDYYSSNFVHAVAVNDIFREIAEFFEMPSMTDTHFDDVSNYNDALTCDDIEALLDSSSFKNGVEILSGFFEKGQISDELVESYHLSGLRITSDDEEEEETHDFPEEHLHNLAGLKNAIRKRWLAPDRIIRKRVLRTVPYVLCSDGQENQYMNTLGRDMAIRRYTPAGSRKCFCQMCQKEFDPVYITVNNIVYLQKTYWPELRLALCLKCSQDFNVLRSNKEFFNRFCNEIKNLFVTENTDPIEVRICKRTLRFTYKHLMEIRAIIADHYDDLTASDSEVDDE